MQGVSKTAIEALACKESSSSTQVGGKRKSPLLDRVYAARRQVLHSLMPRAVQSLLDSSQQQVYQLISLGGGLDTSYDHLTEKHYVLDVVEVIASRRSLYATESTQLPPKLIACDLCDMEQVITLLEQCQFDPSLPTILFAECVLSYLPTAAQGKLWTTFAKYLQGAVVCLAYDPMLPIISGLPHDVHGYSEMMRLRFEGRQAPLRSAMSSVVDSHVFLRQHGWEHVLVTTMQQALQQWIYPYPTLVHELDTGVMFDEHASLLMLHSLYSIRIAANDSCTFHNLQSVLFPSTDTDVQLKLKLAEYQTKALEVMKSCNVACSTVSSELAIDVCAGEAELAQISALYQESFAEYADKYQSVKKFIKSSMKELSNFFKYYPASTSSRLFVARKGQSVVGCVSLKVYSKVKDGHSEQFFELGHFCVHPSYRQQGVGHKLLEHWKTYCEQEKVKKVQLTVLNDLEKARRLYLQMGFLHTKTTDLSNDCIIHSYELVL